jgi:hypothetical protein
LTNAITWYDPRVFFKYPFCNEYYPLSHFLSTHYFPFSEVLEVVFYSAFLLPRFCFRIYR